MVILDAPTLAKATGAKLENAQRYLPFIQGTCKAYDITSRRRLAMFLSQIGHESAGLSKVVESLNYSVEGLLRTFRGRIAPEQAALYGRAPGRPANQMAIADIVYGGEWGRRHLGNTEPGDGSRFIGRGLKQLTGRDNAFRCGKALGEDFVRYPERLTLPVNAALSAGWFWSSRNLNRLADAEDLEAVTREVNGGLNGLDYRIALYKVAINVCV